MVIATPKYKLLVPLIEVEPNTSAIPPVDRVSLAFSDQEQLITRFNTGMPLSVGGTVDRGIYGIFNPSDSNRPSGTVQVIVQPIAGDFSPLLYVGPYTLIAGRDYAVGGGLAATATNIATAISNLPGYDAVPAGAIITVQGPKEGVGLRFYADYRTSSKNFTFTYVKKVYQLGMVTSSIEPPIIV